MNIVVCIKQVPDTTKVKINPETNTLMREGVESIINPFDMYAIEEGVRLREMNGGTVKVLTMGPPQAEAALREAVALGVDEADVEPRKLPRGGHRADEIILEGCDGGEGHRRGHTVEHVDRRRGRLDLQRHE